MVLASPPRREAASTRAKAERILSPLSGPDKTWMKGSQERRLKEAIE